MINCPQCNLKTTVLETRGNKRRRMCLKCRGEIITYETTDDFCPLYESGHPGMVRAGSPTGPLRRIHPAGENVEVYANQFDHVITACAGGVYSLLIGGYIKDTGSLREVKRTAKRHCKFHGLEGKLSWQPK